MKKNVPLFESPRIYSIQDMVLQSAEKYSLKVALEDLNNTPLQKVTFRQMLDFILHFGAALRDLGLKEGAHIALIGENRVQWSISYLTCMCFNYVVVPIDKNLTTNEILNIIHESDSEAIIFSDTFSGLLSEGHLALKRLKHMICMDKTGVEKDFLYMLDLIEKSNMTKLTDLPKIDPEETAVIIYTSGSLGRAKGVMLTQKNLASNLMDMVSMIFIGKDDRFLSVLPIHHTYECTCGMLCPLFSGASVHYARSLKTVVDDMQKVKPTILLGVPLLFDKMFKRISKAIKDDKVKNIIVPPLVRLTDIALKVGFRSIKKKIFHEMHERFGGNIRIFIAGGAAPDPLVAKGLENFGFTFVQGYGLTETSPILTLNRLHNYKHDAAGEPLPNVKVRINSPDENGSGEVWVKAPSVMKGYYKNEQLTKEAFEDGWFKTGDIGHIDEDGFLHINGRKKNVIISKSGKNVFPEEIEDVLTRSPFVLECIVSGEEDAKQGEIINAQIVVDAEAFIELAETTNVTITEQLIRDTIAGEIEKVNKQLASYKQIKKFVIRETEFEKTTTQKIKRYLIKNNHL